MNFEESANIKKFTNCHGINEALMIVSEKQKYLYQKYGG